MNSLQALRDQGQSFWIDSIDRRLVTGGELRRLIVADGLRGLTSNPSIFQSAIAGSSQYDDALRAELESNPGANALALYESVAIVDIQGAADALRPIYDGSAGTDGFVSLEVAPGLARDTGGTLAEARRLWATVARPNLMIKVPATPEGMPAIEDLIAGGINVNVTLIFSVNDHYAPAAEAYLRGIERNPDPRRTASVASFFISRMDTAIDSRLSGVGTEEARGLQGRAAVANAKLAYRRFGEFFDSERFARQRARGARPQRLLWGSTSTKNPAYRDVLYVEELIGPETVNTVPPATVDAFRNHGVVRATLQDNWADAEAALHRIAALGIDIDQVAAQLQLDGLAAFAGAFEQLLAAVSAKVASEAMLPAGAHGGARSV